MLKKVTKTIDIKSQIIISVAQGRVETARHFLSFHPLKNSSAFRAVDEQLRSMPNFSVIQFLKPEKEEQKAYKYLYKQKSLGHLSLFEFKAKWEYWQKKCIQVLTNENFQIEETGTLEIICKVVLFIKSHITLKRMELNF